MPRGVKKLWARWLRFAKVIGTIQMIILLSVAYWTFLAPAALFFKLFADPLVLRRPGHARWIERPSTPITLDDMRKQY